MLKHIYLFLFLIYTQASNLSAAEEFEFGSYPNLIESNKYITNNDNGIFPAITSSVFHEVDKGYIFISNFSRPNIPNTPYLLILDNYGKPIFYRVMPSACFDFKLQNGNMFTYFQSDRDKFYAMDFNFNIIDSFYCGNGYWTDPHELIVLPNGYAYLMGSDTMVVDMSQIVPGGDTIAVVAGLVIQEIDANKNVIFQWRSFDHFQVTDATHEDLTAHRIDYVHGNCIEPDLDGNIIISSRHMDEITKINRQNGSIIWRLGGKHNQFRFTNDPIMFSHQHSARRLRNGNLLLFDNGNFHSPPFSRAVEYKLDEVNMTVTKVWEYRNSPDIFGFAMGSVQRLSNGNTLIGWGATNPTVTEVRPNGTKALELSLPGGVWNYRAFRFLWSGAPPVADITFSNLLLQNYPNPFNSTTTIKYELASGSYVVLKVYNIQGSEIKTLVNGYQEAGINFAYFDSSNLSSGIYFYKLFTPNLTQSKKMLIIK